MKIVLSGFVLRIPLSINFSTPLSLQACPPFWVLGS
ncbi:unnamed protein product [Discula destructiva]